MANSTPQGYSGAYLQNPYSYSQVAVTWSELLAQANVAFSYQGDQTFNLGTEGFVEITTESFSNILLDTLPFSPIYFNTWVLALIVKTWANFVIDGPTLFNYGQAVLVNPVAEQASVGSSIIYTNQVFNPNFGQISILDSRSLWIVPNDFVPEGVVPI